MNKRIRCSRPIRTPLRAACVLLLAPLSVWAEPPSQPGSITATVLDDGSTQLNWGASSDDIDVAGYNVYRNNTYITTVSSTNHTVTADRSQSHSYYVVAFDVPGDAEQRSFSSRSPQFTLAAISDANNPEPEASPVPTAASNLIAVRTSETTASLGWTAASDDIAVEGYNVYRDNQYLSTVSNLSFDDNQLSDGVAYEYYVVAFDGPRNFSPRSVTASLAATPDTMPEPMPEPIPEEFDTEAPSVVGAINIAALTTSEVSLDWEDASDNVGVDGYNVYRNGGYLTTVNSSEYIDAALPDTEIVSYQIVAFDMARNFSLTSPSRSINPANDLGDRPPLVDFNAEPIPGPDASDPFGFTLELGLNSDAPTAGGPPTTPVNLRAELVSNDWAEINWAPSSDDTAVVAYNIYRSDGHVYTVAGDQTDDNAGTQAELDKFWRTTSFIDCNYTRFSDRIHDCQNNGPKPGDKFSYSVTAVDDEGNESAMSDAITIHYHLEQNAPVPLYRDFYLDGDDRFASENDLSQTQFFLDEFQLVFNEDFDGTDIDSSKWNTQLTWGDSRIINGEQQYFVNTQSPGNIDYQPFTLTGDSLIIEAIPTPEDTIADLPPVCFEEDSTGNERCAFLSGALSSHDLFGMTFGYVEGRMKVGSEAGMLSSFYLYHRYPGTGLFQHAPEIDIVEYLGENPFGDEDAFQTYHYDDIVDASIKSAPTMAFKNPEGDLYSDDFHTFGVLWEPQLVIWYIDGQEIKRMTGPQVGRQQMNIVLYLVAGSAWAPTPDITADIFPLQFEIDYIRAYQRAPFNGNGIYP